MLEINQISTFIQRCAGDKKCFAKGHPREMVAVIVRTGPAKLLPDYTITGLLKPKSVKSASMAKSSPLERWIMSMLV
jgi:hypothetical protein